MQKENSLALLPGLVVFVLQVLSLYIALILDVLGANFIRLMYAFALFSCVRRVCVYVSTSMRHANQTFLSLGESMPIFICPS